MQNNTKGILYACTTALLWGFLAIILKFTNSRVDAVTIVWFRFLVAFVALAVWQLITAPKSFKILVKPPVALVFAAAALTGNYLGFMLGIHYTTPSNAQLFVQLGPILLAVAGFILFKEKINSRQIVGFIIAIIGFVFFYRDQLSVFFNNAGNYHLGVFITFSGALLWTVYSVLQKRLIAKYSATELNLVIFALPIIVLAPFIKLETLSGLSIGWWILLIALGLNSVVAYTFVPLALKYTEAHKVSIILILNPMITLLTMSILSKMNVSWIEPEHFSSITILGAVFIFVGAVLVSIKKKKVAGYS